MLFSGVPFSLIHLKCADGYYLKNGQPTTEPVDIGFSIKPLRQLHGHTLASEFGPIRLKAVRHGLLAGLRTILSDVEKASTREPLEIAGDCPPLTIMSQGAPHRSRMPVALAWLFLGIVGWLVFGPLYFRALRPPHDRITDYFQDWASARNHLTGRPVYTEHTTSLPLYVGVASYPDPRMARNAHPPTSVLLALPLGYLPFREAALAWNLVSLSAFVLSLLIVVSALGLAPAKILPILALLSFCHPLYANVHQCQLTLFLVLLVTGVWVLDRAGHHVGAGAILGTVAAIKLFPGYLAVYFLARRQYKLLAAALIAFLSWSVLTALILGRQAYHDYVQLVMPGLSVFRSYEYNLSLAGFWHKLFDPVAEAELIRPLWSCPGLASSATLLSDLAVTALIVIAAHGARDTTQRDFAFTAVVTAMLLVSPITWDFSLPLLLVPIMVLSFGTGTRRSLCAMLLLGTVLTVFWLPQDLLTDLAGRPVTKASPFFLLGMPSVKFYGILGLLGLILRQSGNLDVGRKMT